MTSYLDRNICIGGPFDMGAVKRIDLEYSRYKPVYIAFQEPAVTHLWSEPSHPSFNIVTVYLYEETSPSLVQPLTAWLSYWVPLRQKRLCDYLWDKAGFPPGAAPKSPSDEDLLIMSDRFEETGSELGSLCREYVKNRHHVAAVLLIDSINGIETPTPWRTPDRSNALSMLGPHSFYDPLGLPSSL